jgi:hypothetical protein
MLKAIIAHPEIATFGIGLAIAIGIYRYGH